MITIVCGLVIHATAEVVIMIQETFVDLVLPLMQVAPFDLLNSLERMHEDSWQQPMLQAQPEIASTTAAQQILSMAGRQ